ncbi:hypothetical protein FRX31_027035 [Thalictrum thalictroides]|uniref:LysM domain-containing protein n=1 Tax=Thalictrum thalictroides TaxID=46969 RepID=A0A7J6VFL1_THATH|nr:hypothetical protein FRX31_027035 [Thalictrum thalictroides]
MAIKMNSKSSMFLNIIVLMLSLLLIISMAEGRVPTGVNLFGQPKPVYTYCAEVIGVKKGDTCFDIAQSLNMTAKAFNSINPGITCTNLFVGQWICISGVTI